MPAPLSSLSPGDRRDPRCPVRGRGATWRSKSQDQMEKAFSSTGGASSQSWAGNSAALGCHLSGIQVTQESPTSGKPPEADQKGEGACCRSSLHPGSGLTVAPYLGTHSGLPTQPPSPRTIAPLLCYLNSLLYYPPAAGISPPIKRHRWDCWGSLHSVSCMLWRAQSRSLPGPWSRGLPGRQKTCVVEHACSLLSHLSCPPHLPTPLGASVLCWGCWDITSPPWGCPLPPGSPPAPNTDDLLFREAESPRSCEPDSCFEPQPPPDLIIYGRPSVCSAPQLLPPPIIAVNTSQCSLNVPSGFCISREGHRTFWWYQLSSLEN